jgi:hypothetical protein
MRIVSGAIMLATCLATASVASAVTRRWANPNGGFWQDPSNRDPPGEPTIDDAVVIDLPGDYIVALPFLQQLAKCDTLVIGSTMGNPELQSITGGGLGSGISIQSGGLILANAKVALQTLFLNGDLTVLGELNMGNGGEVRAGNKFIDILPGVKFIVGNEDIANPPQVAITDATVSHDGDVVLLSVVLTGRTLLFKNFSTQSMNVTGNASLVDADGTFSLENDGALNVLEGSLTLDLPLVSPGSVHVMDGTLTLNGTADVLGPVTVDAGGTLVLGSGGTRTFSGGITGAGLVRQSGALTVLSAAASFGSLRTTGGTINVDAPTGVTTSWLSEGGFIGGTNTLTVNGNADYWSGSFTGTGTTVLGASGLHVVDDPAVADPVAAIGSMQNGYTLENRGMLTWRDMLSICGTTSKLINAAGATVDITGRAGLSNAGGVGTALENAGTLKKTAGVQTDISGVPFTNTGTVSVEAGTLHFTSSYALTAGSTNLGGGALVADMGLDIQGGTLTGGGSVTGDVTNGGTVSPGASTGTLTIAGDFTQQATGTLAMEVGGIEPGSEFDRVQSTGTANLAGTLAVNFTGGFVPAAGDTIDILTAPTVQGAFGDVTGLDSAAGKVAVASVTATTVSLLGTPSIGTGAATAAAEGEVNVPFLVDSAAACVSLSGIGVSFDAAEVGFARVQDVRAGCDVVVNVVGAGMLDVDATCVAGTTGMVTLAQLVFTLQPGAPDPAALRFDCMAATGSDCGDPPASLAVKCVDVEPVRRCPPGDIHPDGVGNFLVQLADFVLARRKILGIVGVVAHDLECGDLHPGNQVCTPADGPASWCIAGNAMFQLGDVVVLRRLLLEILQVACAPCRVTPTADARLAPPLPGDVAPAGGDGRVDVADVVKLLRFAVRLDVMSETERRLGDVAPCAAGTGPLPDVGEPEAGSGVVDIGDVVLLLRASVGLSALAWPERALDIDFERPMDAVAFSAVLTGWPAWAEPLAFESPRCVGGEAGLDVGGGTVGVTCVSDPLVMTGLQHAGTIRYRAPVAIDTLRLAVAAEAVDAELDDLPRDVVVTAR